jgi:hypothetical protein
MPIVSGDMKVLKEAETGGLLEGGVVPTELQIADSVKKSSFSGLSALKQWSAPVSTWKIF